METREYQAAIEAILFASGEPVPLARLAQALESMRLKLEGKNYIEQYVYALTHELKSPLAAIRGAVNGMMLQVIQGHLTDHVVKEPDETQREADLETVMQVIKSYLK